MCRQTVKFIWSETTQSLKVFHSVFIHTTCVIHIHLQCILLTRWLMINPLVRISGCCLSSSLMCLCAPQVQSCRRGLLSSARHWHPATGGPDRSRGAGQSQTIHVFLLYGLFIFQIWSHCGSVSFKIICHHHSAARIWCLCVQGAGLTLFSQSAVMLDFLMHQ